MTHQSHFAGTTSKHFYAAKINTLEISLSLGLRLPAQILWLTSFLISLTPFSSPHIGSLDAHIDRNKGSCYQFLQLKLFETGGTDSFLDLPSTYSLLPCKTKQENIRSIFDKSVLERLLAFASFVCWTWQLNKTIATHTKAGFHRESFL